jgi:hypothetical protein
MSESNFVRDIEEIINRHSQENNSHTPDFILAEYIKSCLRAFDTAVNTREHWYGRGVAHGTSLPASIDPEPSDLDAARSQFAAGDAPQGEAERHA